MEIPTKQDLIDLMQEREGPHVSLYMPAHRLGAETRENPIRFKNLLTQAQQGLEDTGMRATLARDMLAPLTALEDDYDYWQQQSDGLAVFVSEAGIRQFRVPVTLPELALVQPRFHLKPLLPLLSKGASFHVLALSANQTQLLACTPLSQHEVKVDGMPDGLSDALWADDPEKQNQFRSFDTGASGNTMMMHGAGGSTPDMKDDLLRYFHIVDRAVTPYLNEHGGPLVLACVDYLAPIYRETNEYNELRDQNVGGSPDRVSEEELRNRAWEILQPELDAEREQALDRYRASAGTGLTTSDPAEAALAAITGKVDTAFVTIGQQRWGRVDAEAYTVETHDEPEPGDYDLLDVVGAHTLMNGGTVYAVEPDAAPDASGVIAIFRYA